MRHYVMNVSSTDGRFHEVHHDNCPHRPYSPNRVHIGYHNSDHDAIISAKAIYRDADGCFYCMPTEHHG